MKIIGHSQRGFIIDASGDEVSNLIGFYYLRSEGCPKIEVGSEITVSAMYRQLYKLGQLSKEIENSQTILRAAADSLAPIVPLLKQITD